MAEPLLEALKYQYAHGQIMASAAIDRAYALGRVSRHPKCETCSNSTVNPKMVQQFSSDCDLAPGQPDERVCLVWEAFVPHDGYCHLHPQAQEVTR